MKPQAKGPEKGVAQYFECPVCGYLSPEPRFASGEAACPVCHAEAHPRRSFPSDRLRRLDDRIRRYREDGEYEIVVILVAAFLEALIEDLLDRILKAHGADLQVRRVVLDTQRAIGGRLGRLFPHLTGTEFEEAAADLGYRDFPRRWRQMREARNAFIHDSPFNGVRESLDEGMARQAMELLDQSYPLFVSSNNRFVAERRAHPPHGQGSAEPL